MKILMLAHRFYKDSDLRMSYGAWTTVYKLCVELAKHVDMTLIAGGKGDEKIGDINVIRVPMFGTEVFKDYCISYNIFALKAAARQDFDLMQSQGVDGSLFFGLTRKKIPKVSTIFALSRGQINARSYNYTWKDRVAEMTNNFWEDMMIRNSDLFFTFSEYLKREIADITGTKKDIRVLYNGIDTKEFRPVDSDRGKFGLKDNDKAVLFMGGTSQRKGIDIMLKSFVSAKREHPDLKLMIVGAKDLKSYSSLVPNEFLSDIKLLGSIYKNSLIEAYNACDILAFPSFHEGMAAAPLEAMACEKPVVAFNNTGLPEEVTEKEGILVETGNSEAFGNALIHLLDNPKKARVMGKRGRERVQKLFTIEKLAERYLENYKRLI